jgi:S-adenosylmethionine:tRNA ribosyltransferase-isomerase
MEPWLDYTLPPELIAQQPLRNRADARLLVVDRALQSIEHAYIRDLPEILQRGDRLVLNDTKVIPAQLRGVRIATGGQWQGLFLDVLEDGDWKLVGKTRGRIKPPEAVALLDREGRPAAKLWLLERLEGGQWRARLDQAEDAADLLRRIGRVPLPPYIRGGNMVDADVDRYQTVYARRPGAVAAPTAGLHFTPELLRSIGHAGVEFTAVTLHVGMGTFRPIAAEDPAEHPMHAERAELTDVAAREINQTRAAGGRVVAVGTTAVRVLEPSPRRPGRLSMAASCSPGRAKPRSTFGRPTSSWRPTRSLRTFTSPARRCCYWCRPSAERNSLVAPTKRRLPSNIGFTVTATRC